MAETAGKAGSTFALTREQEGLWVEWKLSPTGLSYNTCVQLRLDGDLDANRFRQANADVIAEFDLLHGYCVEVDGRPRIALSDNDYEVPFFDVSGGALEETEEARSQALALLNRRRDAAIDLTEYPLVRSALVQTARQRFYYIGVVPHLISDGYSAVFILQAMSVAYRGGRSALHATYGKRADRKDWSDYLQWRDARDPELAERAIEHWKTALAGASHITPICHDSELSVADTHGKRHAFGIDADVAERLGKLAFSKRTSLFSALAAIWAAFLSRQCNVDELVVAFPVDLRPPGFREAFGFYVNVIPVRIDTSGNPSFVELLARIGAARRADRKHQHLPSLDIVRAKRSVEPGFDGRLTNVSMGQTVSRFTGLEIEGVQSSALDNALIDVRDDLSLMYEVTESGIGLWLEYRESAFADAEVAEMAARIELLIAAMDADPKRPIGDITLLSNEEEAHILSLGSGLGDPGNTPPSFTEAFAATVDQHGDLPALIDEQGVLSYRDLALAAEQLKASLPKQSAPVLLLLPAGRAQLVAEVAVLTSTMTLMPVDEDTPLDRVATLLRQAKPALVLTTAERVDPLRAVAADAASDRTIRCVALDGAGRLAEAVSTPPLQDQPGADDKSASAYVIFTSGSTGEPKGVVVSHEALAYRLAWLRAAFSAGTDDRMLMNTSIAFDVAFAERLWPLTIGAALVAPNSDNRRDPRALRACIDAQAITLTCLVPSALSALLGQRQAGSLGSLRHVLAAGEALPMAVATDCHDQTSAQLHNVYGPTEATIYASATTLEPGTDRITIGKPIAETELRVIGQSGQLCPVGAEGELCIGGPGLADGYLNQPELTAERFIDNPFGSGRLYKTGDRARLLPSGDIDYLGRRDSQVKLRGYRIELGEISHVLGNQPGVTDAAAAVEQHPTTGRDQLVAWVCGAGTKEADLRAALEAALPVYMQPSRLHCLTSLTRLPRLASGKLNAGALPQSDSPVEPRRSPEHADEHAMARAWSKTLSVPLEEIGVNSSFFELGGDSLMLIGLSSALEEEGLFVDVHELFDHPTIETALPLARREADFAIDQTAATGEYFALPRQRKLLADGFAKPSHWNRCILIAFNRHLDASALQSAMDAIARHHDGLRLSFDTSGDTPRFRYHPPEAVDTRLQPIDLTGVPAAERIAVRDTALNAINAGFQLGDTPLIKLALIDDETSSTVAIVSHHLLIDMRSCQVLLEDLMAAYQASLSGRPLRLPRKSTSLGELSTLLHNTVDASWHADEVDFWQCQLDAVHPAIPGVSRSLERHERDMTSMSMSLGATATNALVRRCSKPGAAAIQDVLLAGFAAAYRDAFGAETLTVNTCGVGRDPEFDGVSLARTVGEINTVYPLSMDLGAADLTGEAHCKRVATPARGQHYGALRYIAVQPALASAPEPDVFFNYVSRIDSALDDAMGATVTMAPTGIVTSAPENRACYGLYAEASIRRGELALEIGYSRREIDASAVARLTQRWREAVAANA